MKICPFCNEDFDGAMAYCSSCGANIVIIKKTFYVDGFDELHSIVYYNDFFREHLFNYKFGMQKKYLSALAYLYEEELKNIMQNEKIDYITSVPMNTEKLRKKGFDHMGEILKIISKDMGIKIYNYEKLQKRDMHKLSFSERANMKNIFKKSSDASGNVVIIDDIITTGTTMKDSARVMKDAGFEKIFGLILCSRR